MTPARAIITIPATRGDCDAAIRRSLNSTDDSDVDITDITDEVIQNYYKYVLDSTKPAQPGEIHVKASQVQDADNNVYGRYEVTWDEPNDTTASPAAYYRVEILPCDAAGKVAPDAVPYLKADVYQRSYTFVADKAWTGNFVVRVTPYNTNNDPTQPDHPKSVTCRLLCTPCLHRRLSSGW